MWVKGDSCRTQKLGSVGLLVEDIPISCVENSESTQCNIVVSEKDVGIVPRQDPKSTQCNIVVSEKDVGVVPTQDRGS